MAGTIDSSLFVTLERIQLLEFDKQTTIDGLNAVVFDAPCRYDAILGRDFLRKIGLEISFKHSTISWNDAIIPMKPHDFWDNYAVWSMLLENDPPDTEIESNWHDVNRLLEYESYSNDRPTKILDAKYEAVSVDQVIKEQQHLVDKDKEKLREVLNKYERLFDGQLGRYPHTQVHLELTKEAHPVHRRAYQVPNIHLETFKKELQHLVQIYVLRPSGPTNWAFPTFIIPKANRTVRWVSDFRELNKVLKRRPYPLPIIHEEIFKRKRYTHFTKIDLSMMFYHFELDEASRDICTIATPFGYFQYCRLAMGLKISPDIAQQIIESVLRDVDCLAYIDDVGIWTDGSMEKHLAVVDQVLHRLQANGFSCNPLKCKWAVQETDFLGYWLTPTGVRPWRKKIDAILKMAPPKNNSELRSFLGAVTYYRTMWPRRSHILSPLTKLTGRGTFEWTREHQEAFDNMKSIMAQEVLLVYPDSNKPYDIYTDASDYQMGACILQNGKPVLYWSRKLSDAQANYSTMEKELLAIVYCLKEFRTILLGARLNVYTDHRNLTFRTLNTQRVLRWRLYLEEYDVNLQYIEGKDNVLADCFSRLPRMPKPTTNEKRYAKAKTVNFNQLSTSKQAEEDDPLEELVSYYNQLSLDGIVEHQLAIDPAVMESFLNFPPRTLMDNPTSLHRISQHQGQDEDLIEQQNTTPERYTIQEINNVIVVCHLDQPGNVDSTWRIAVPTTLLADLVVWYHLVLGHSGKTRLYDTIRARFHHPRLKHAIDNFDCPQCQGTKVLGQGYGHLPPRHVNITPWNEVAIDLIGPWKIKNGGRIIEFFALTCIDPVTNLVEIIRIRNKTAAHIRDQFSNVWLSRYPRPNRCVHDNGGEFTGAAFQELLEQAAITDVTTTSYNPRANSVCERMHQTVANVLRTLLYVRPPQTDDDAAQLVDNAIATTVHATRCAVSRVLQTSPGAMVFQRDMVVDVPFIADLLVLQAHRQELVDENLRRQNAKRREHHHQVGDLVLMKSIDPVKLAPRAVGPFPIVQVYTNGTVEIQKSPHTRERVNIRRIVPYRV